MQVKKGYILMELFETMKKRYSYRGKFKDIEVKDEDLKKMLTAASLAPTGYNQQTTEMIVVTDKMLIGQLGDIYNYEAVKSAPLVIVMVSSCKVRNGLSFEMQDYASETEHLNLAVTSLGYATVWIDGATTVNGISNKVSELLNVPEDKTVRAVLPIGIPETPGQQAPKKSISELVHYNRYGS